MRRFFSGVGLVLLVVCGIVMAVTFVERLPSNPTALAALGDAWRRLLEYVPLFLPIAVFLGTLLASYNLTKSSESIIVASAGLSPYQVSRPFLIGAALIGIVATTIINPYSVELNSGDITSDHLVLIDDEIWLREASDNGYITMNAKNMHKSGNILLFDNATLYIQTPDFKLTQRVQADTITLSDEGLGASRATIWNSRGIPSESDWHIQTLLNPQTVLDRYLQPDQISFWQLPKFIQKMEQIGVPVRAHLVQFWTLLFLPLTMIAMVTLGVAFSQTRQRRNYSFGIKFGMGVLTCFAVYFLVNMFSALGATGTLPPLLAIIAPPLIIIAGAGVFITSFDTI
ncbi:MAG: LptF/LptG family permease [Proteobacteria bacterium]|uniref:LptF/LptG family permease n=1 Tax=Candidatus Enterousia excrementavium TaxID=2840789 RepID=A0A940DDZ2_9PROT|nr:LptF/LptG family permease [Candidatus Enterousia excrementavium]